MPPAFVLSQDQTLKLCHIHQWHGRNRKPQTHEIQEPIPALSNVMDTKDMHGNDLINRYPEPKYPRTGRRRPHVPSSKSTMSKSHRQNKADNQRTPFLVRGTRCPLVLATRAFEPFEAAFPSGDRASNGDLRFGQRSFFNFVSFAYK